MEEKIDIKSMLKNVIMQKEDTVGSLVSILKSTNDFNMGNQIALILVDHFRDDRIEACLVNLIKDSRWKMHNGTLIFALRLYTNDQKYLYYLIDLVLKSEQDDNGEVFMGAYSMIINLHPPLDVKEISRAIQRVKREEKKENISTEQKRLIDSLLNYLEGQQKIAEFYNQFDSDNQ